MATAFPNHLNDQEDRPFHSSDVKMPETEASKSFKGVTSGVKVRQWNVSEKRPISGVAGHLYLFGKIIKGGGGAYGGNSR